VLALALALPQTPLDELTVLPQTPSWINGTGGKGKKRGRDEGRREGEGNAKGS